MNATENVQHRGRVHIAGRSFKDHSGGDRHMPACGSWTKRSHEYPRRTDDDVTCTKCAALVAKADR